MIGRASFFLLACTALPVAAASNGGPPDRDIAAWVVHALRTDAWIRADEVRVAVEGGIVKLSGRIPTVTGKQYAVRETQRIRGVRGVVDQLELATRARDDSGIAKEVGAAIAQSSVLATASIGAVVEAGIVTLSGEAESWSQTREAVMRAGLVPGVRRVYEEIRIKPAKMRSDQSLQADISAALARDVYLSPLPIEVDVSRGKVWLRGEVQSPYERSRAYDDARLIAGVQEVENALAVAPVAPPSERHLPVGTPSDERLRDAVAAELLFDGRVDSTQIEIRSQSGRVTLSGSVPEHGQIALALRDARDVVGVAWVTNQLLARSEIRGDALVEGDVRRALESDPFLRGREISVTVREGRVRLSGRVRSAIAQAEAATIAGGIRGARSVDDELVIDWPQSPSDAAIARHIRERLEGNWKTFLVEDLVEVSVAEGIAQLSGTVATWAERREAARIARATEGVNGLKNDLRVNEATDYPWDEWEESEQLDDDLDDLWKLE